MIAARAPFIDVAATRIYAQQQASQARFVALTNPAALRAHLSFPVSAESVRIFERHNALPMKLWAANSLAPHCYVMSICAMFDRLDVYLYLRLMLANGMFLVTLLLQRRATRLTDEAMHAANLAPVPASL